MIPWHLRSWKNAVQYQDPQYPDASLLDTAVAKLSELPPLVTTDEVDTLKQQIAEAAEGKRFILQAGDCAESFDECNVSAINKRLKILQQMSLVLMHGYTKPVTTVGRIAGQYAKPRSDKNETINNKTLPCYRGDLINGQAFTQKARLVDPERLLEGYGYASMTLNYIRSLKSQTFAELNDPSVWDIAYFNDNSSEQQRLSQVGQSINLLDNLHAPLTDLFTSHEALNLYYEQALTREHEGKWYNLSTHFPWLGMRTAISDSAHIEYLRGIENPVAIKVGPEMSADDLLSLIEKLNPQKELGKITLISRFGTVKVIDYLPKLIKAVNASNHPVLWSCDPMHGNTRITKHGLKTRDIETIHEELRLTILLHQENNSHLGGIHLETSGEDVTECCGGLSNLTDEMLETNYQSLLDPRLSRDQALEIALFLTQQMENTGKTETTPSIYLAGSRDTDSI